MKLKLINSIIDQEVDAVDDFQIQVLCHVGQKIAENTNETSYASVPRSYLEIRRQRSLVIGHLSHERAIKCGVPQGSILGLLLFLVFINYPPNCLNLAILSMYADDTSLTVSASDTASLETQI